MWLACARGVCRQLVQMGCGGSRAVHTAVHSVAAPPLVLAGPSGSGKSSLLDKLFKEYSSAFAFSVSHTTRKPRPGEIHGKAYFFTTKEELEAGVARGEFVESTTFAGNMYGTSKHAVQSVIDAGKICVLDIDVAGCQSVRKTDLNARFIFIAPPSLEALEKRLRVRGTETEDSLAARLGNAKREMDYGNTPGNFDKVIINDDIDTAYAELVDFLKDDIARTRSA
eukprot:m.417968 g.417968  ORF g.417968 m.417968 type:complete len:225 (-) comp56621_c0_seq7:1639-2313(-)